MRFFLFIFFLLPSLSTAFINIESVRRQSGEGFLGRSNLQFSGHSGNTDKQALHFATLNIYRGERDEVLGLANYSYAHTSNIRDTNNGQAHLRYTFFYTKKNAPEIYVQSAYDELKELNARHLAGANLRHKLFYDEKLSLFLGAGAFYEIEDYQSVHNRQGFRGNLYISFVQDFNERTSASGSVYYQPLLKAQDDYRVRLQAGVEVSMTESLSLNLQYNLKHDNWTPTAVEKTDTSYTAGISLRY